MFPLISFLILLSVIIYAIKTKHIGYGGGHFTWDDSPEMFLFMLGVYGIALIISIILLVRSFIQFFGL